MFDKQNQRKYIPVLAVGTWETSLPNWARGKKGVDLSKRPFSEQEFEKLVGAIKNVKHSSTQKDVKVQPVVESCAENQEEIRILEIIKEERLCLKMMGHEDVLCIKFLLDYLDIQVIYGKKFLLRCGTVLEHLLRCIVQA